MKKSLILLIGIMLLLSGCHKAQKTVNQSDSKIENSHKDSKAIIALYKEVDSLTQHGRMDREKMQQFVNEAINYAKLNPKDTLSPHFMLYAGINQMQVAFSNADEKQRREQALEAINILEKLRQNYPDYRNMIYAYYYKGQIYENLGMHQEAAKTYRALVERFPDTELGKSIAAYLQADGYEKSAEEIMQGFH